MNSSSSSQRSGWSGRSSRGMTALGPPRSASSMAPAGMKKAPPTSKAGSSSRSMVRAGHASPRSALMISGGRVDGHDLEVVPRRPEQVDGDGPHVEHAGELLDDLLQGAREVLVEGARLHLDQPAQGLQGGARLDRHGGQCPTPAPRRLVGQRSLRRARRARCGQRTAPGRPGRSSRPAGSGGRLRRRRRGSGR